MFAFKLPDPGEGLTEAEITQWLVSVGDEVRVNDILVEIETAKSLVELPSPVSGTVRRLLAEVGQTVEVGTPIIEIDDGSADEPDSGLEAEPSSAPQHSPVPGSKPGTGVVGGQNTESLASTRGDADEAADATTTGSAGGQSAAQRSVDENTDEAEGQPKSLVGSGPLPEPKSRRRPHLGSALRKPGGAANGVVSRGVDVAGVRSVAHGDGGSAETANPDRTGAAGSSASSGDAVHAPGRAGSGFAGGAGPGTTAHRAAVAEPAGSRQAQTPSEPGPITTAVGKVLAKPLVRRLARDLGVKLASIRPTGPGGTVSREDVEAAAGIGGHTPAESAGGPGSALVDHIAPIKGVRKATAQNVAESIAKHVHVTEFNTIDISATKTLVEQLKKRREFRDLHVSPLLLHAKAVCLALARHPELNATWDGEAGEIIYHDEVNLGIAAATPRGLLVPVIRRADKMNLVELCRAINELVVTARDGKLQPADYSGGTFSITNVGVFGIDTGTPIINGDESGILAMGAIKRRPWVVGSGEDEQIVPRWVTTLAVSFDHQLIDGEQGSQFLGDISTVLESPELSLLF
ncbi:2-oxo acid dehydrogenase subunit E2 [Propionimicrobium sp. PCR01-08-3]|uniref:2-oxo acid dehydrogenase subunit E2 n=1 Tax=Propionimicrobium sp. PCR01-08-3 TaxID=3052086 RepID=UPI00333FCD27